MTTEVNQKQDEPVAYFNPQKGGFYWAKPTTVTAPITVDVEPLPLYTTPQQGCAECGVGGGYALYCLSCAEKFFGNKEWVGLTEEELIVIKGKTCPEIDWSARHGVPLNNGEQNAWLFTWFMAFAKETEAKLKEKNT